jgi:antitoxin component YwqK of YwqJK toxin-antitoxin module
MAYQTYRFFPVLALLFAISYACKEEPILVKVTDENGVLTMEYFVIQDSVRHGQSLTYYDNGKDIFLKENYRKGNLHGERIIYFPNGSPEIVEHYRHGRIHGALKAYYENGQLELSGMYTDGTMNGTLKKFYPGGQLKEEVSFANNIEEGPFTEYHPNGNIHWTGTYRNGDNEVGELKEFDEDGLLVKKMFCDSLSICKTTWQKEES